MRLRKKKHLEERIANVKHLILARTEYEFYQQHNSDKYQILDLAECFGNNNEIVLEIGCGRGGYANGYGMSYPNTNIVAVEKQSNVIVEACEHTHQLQLNNVKYINSTAENLLYYLPPNSIDHIKLNFSCPFPKATYANRRLTCPKMLNIFAQLLKVGGTVTQKTDNDAFFEYSLLQYQQCNYTTLELTRDLHNSEYVNGNIETEYESKFVSLGKTINYTKVQVNK